ncbi:uncharacterized protein TNCV_1834821 [Trichonephila clavipes]|nr:uncharacterized protein TNCV_1834821 [Trichonephila clavipes]
MDDVIISSPSFTHHVEHLREVFRLLQEAGLTLNKKCKFGCDKLKYLALIISKDGITTEETKVRAIVEMKPPKNSKEYFRRVNSNRRAKKGPEIISGYLENPEGGSVNVNDQHDTKDQFLLEFVYAFRTAWNETTGRTPAELFLGRKLITPFQKLVMVSDRTEFAVGDIEKLFDEARQNIKAKHEKWAKYYDRRKHNVQIKVNDWVLVKTHPLSSAAQKVVAKFKTKFEGHDRVFEVKQ